MVDEAKQEDNFEPTPYKHSNRKELDETETVEEKDTEEATPQQTTSFLDSNKQTKQQEHDFKKRYDDLKSHYDRKVNEWKEKEKTLNEQVQPTYKVPKSPEELAMFKEKYPDVYNVVETISHLQADKRVQDIETRLEELRDEETKIVQQNAIKELNGIHPDFNELKDDTNFNKWLNEQPENISDGIYKNNTNAKWAARIIDLYKAEHNLQTKQTTKPNAAQAVTKTNRGSITTEGGKKIWSVSEIAKLRPQQFAKYEKEIDLARREGRIQT